MKRETYVSQLLQAPRIAVNSHIVEQRSVNDLSEKSRYNEGGLKPISMNLSNLSENSDEEPKLKNPMKRLLPLPGNYTSDTHMKIPMPTGSKNGGSVC